MRANLRPSWISAFLREMDHTFIYILLVSLFFPQTLGLFKEEYLEHSCQKVRDFLGSMVEQSANAAGCKNHQSLSRIQLSSLQILLHQINHNPQGMQETTESLVKVCDPARMLKHLMRKNANGDNHFLFKVSEHYIQVGGHHGQV